MVEGRVVEIRNLAHLVHVVGEDDALESAQNVTEQYEGELDDRYGTCEGDLQKITEANETIETKESVSELIQAKEAATRDIDFLSEQIERARDARNKSEAIQKALNARVHSSG